MKNAIWAACLCVASLFAAGCEDDFATVLNLRDDEPAVPVDPTPADPDVAASAIKLGSYNLWISTKGTGDYLWTNRRPILAQSIVDNAFDIFGFQEADETIKNELPVLVAQAGGTGIPYIPPFGLLRAPGIKGRTVLVRTPAGF